MNIPLLSRVKACSAGVKIGDAMGMPWELKTHEEIMAETDGKGVTGFCEPKKRRTDLKLPLGSSTDDWALTRALARSLIRRKGFDLYDMAAAQIRELRSELGWGGTTRRAMTQMETYFLTLGEAGRSPAEPLSPVLGDKGAGNGVAIKISPLVLWEVVKSRGWYYNDTILYQQVKAVGLQTHPNPLAFFSACVLALLLGEILRHPIDSDAEKRDAIPKVLHFLHNNDRRFDCRLIYQRLNMIADNVSVVDADWFRQHIGTSCYAPESVMFAIATFLRHPTDFRAAVLEAVNAGGDTDSTASMVGALVGANCGLDAIPEEWLNFRPDFCEPLELGEKLFNAAQNAR